MAELPRNDHFLTLKEAAAYVRIHPKSFALWLKKKNGPPVRRFGNRIRLPKDKFIKWANAGTGD